jgi:hypothetical protein
MVRWQGPGRRWEGESMAKHIHDVFISHASEDKETFVRPLAVALGALGVTVWYDEFSLRPGDSLSRSIDKGIAGSRHGLVIISRAFLQKPWPEYELRGLVTREIAGAGRIVPIWHGVNKDDVSSFSPSLADKVAIRTDDATAEDIAIQILAEVRPDIYETHPRNELQKLASGHALVELQNELEALRDDLANFQCPHCGSFQVEHSIQGYDEDETETTIYECDLHKQNDITFNMCRRNPKFPKFGDYDIECRELEHELWECAAWPKTAHARGHRFGPVKGHTKEEAEENIFEAYRRSAGHQPDPSIMIIY